MEAPQALVDTNTNEHNTMEPEKEFSHSLPLLTRLRLRFDSDIDSKWADLVLLGCFYTTGMVDAIAFNTWSCFVGMQTGWSSLAADFIEDRTDKLCRKHHLRRPWSQSSS